MTPKFNLKQIRQLYGLSQAEVADAIGIKSRTTINSIETGDRDITTDELSKLADYLGADLLDLLAFDLPNFDKYKEMLSETLRRYEAYSGHSAPKTLLAKLIYLIDFAWYYDNLAPMSGMKYRRDQYGPVPDQFFKIVDDMLDSGDLQLEVKKYPGRTTPSQSLSLTADAKSRPVQYLSDRELATIDKVVKKWHRANTDEIVDFTHHQMPWQVTRPNEFIPYELITQEDPDNVY